MLSFPGGVDSSAVVAMMADLMAEPVNTCSISFGDPAFNESQYAQKVADRYGTHHHVEQVDQNDFDLIDRLAFLYDEPFADSSAMPTYRFASSRENVSLLHCPGMAATKISPDIAAIVGIFMKNDGIHASPWISRPLFGVLGGIYPKADWAPKFLRAKSTFEALARDTVEGYFHSVSIMKDRCVGVCSALLSIATFRDTMRWKYCVLHADKCPVQDPLSRVQYLDMKTYLVGDILTKVDRARWLMPWKCVYRCWIINWSNGYLAFRSH